MVLQKRTLFWHEDYTGLKATVWVISVYSRAVLLQNLRCHQKSPTLNATGFTFEVRTERHPEPQPAFLPQTRRLLWRLQPIYVAVHCSQGKCQVGGKLRLFALTDSGCGRTIATASSTRQAGLKRLAPVARCSSCKTYLPRMPAAEPSERTGFWHLM